MGRSSSLARVGAVAVTVVLLLVPLVALGVPGQGGGGGNGNGNSNGGGGHGSTTTTIAPTIPTVPESTTTAPTVPEPTIPEPTVPETTVPETTTTTSTTSTSTTTSTTSTLPPSPTSTAPTPPPEESGGPVGGPPGSVSGIGDGGGPAAVGAVSRPTLRAVLMVLDETIPTALGAVPARLGEAAVALAASLPAGALRLASIDESPYQAILIGPVVVAGVVWQALVGSGNYWVALVSLVVSVVVGVFWRRDPRPATAIH